MCWPSTWWIWGHLGDKPTGRLWGIISVALVEVGRTTIRVRDTNRQVSDQNEKSQASCVETHHSLLSDCDMWHTPATVTSLPWTVSQNKPFTLYRVCCQHFITTAERYWGRGIVLTTLIHAGPGGYLMTKSGALPSFLDQSATQGTQGGTGATGARLRQACLLLCLPEWQVPRLQLLWWVKAPDQCV